SLHCRPRPIVGEGRRECGDHGRARRQRGSARTSLALCPAPRAAGRPAARRPGRTVMIAFVFPGQGAQRVGMGRALAESFPICRATFEEADAALGERLSTLCFEGPDDRLMLTENTQPAILAMSTAVSRLAVSRGPRARFAAGPRLRDD